MADLGQATVYAQLNDPAMPPGRVDPGDERHLGGAFRDNRGTPLEATPSLIVVIGRRRAGKSFLLDRTFAGARVISLQGDEQDERHQLELFATEAGRVLLGTDALRFETWDAALTFLGEQARNAPLTVILDEFQWLKYARPPSTQSSSGIGIAGTARHCR